MHHLHGHTRHNDGQADGAKEISANSRALSLNDPALLCKYKSGKCSNRRATKRNGQLHTLCPFHRVRQNEHQRKSDRKHRLVSVVRRSKLGMLGEMPSQSDRRHRRDSISSISSNRTSESGSAPASPLEVRQHLLTDNAASSPDRYEFHQQMYVDAQASSTHIRRQDELIQTGAASVIGQTRMGSFVDMTAQPSHIHWRINLSRKAKEVGDSDLRIPESPSPSTPLSTPFSRLPPISFLTSSGKMDSFRSSSHASMNFSPSLFLKRETDSNGRASKMA